MKTIYSVVRETAMSDNSSFYHTVLVTDNQEAAMCRYTSEKLIKKECQTIHLTKSVEVD